MNTRAKKQKNAAPASNAAHPADGKRANEPIRILLADAHALNRAGLRALLARFPNFQVVAEATTGREIIRQVVAHKPRVLLAGVSLATTNNLVFLRRAVRRRPATRSLILCAQETNSYLTAALRYGVSGCLHQRATEADLAAAVTTVARGDTYYSPTVQRLARQEARLPASAEAEPLTLLTPRQIDVLQLIAEGNSTKEVAHILKVSPKTVETHRAMLMERLQIFDVPSLVRFAIRHGLAAA
jgi:DNA-binding NarL/FixJ family response regulator